MFDMPDSQRQHVISEGDSLKKKNILLQQMDRGASLKKGSKGRRKSTGGHSQSHRRPSTPPPSGSKTTPRPAGPPPPHAKRRIRSLPPKGRRGDACSSVTVALNLASCVCPEGSQEGRKRASSVQPGTLNPISSPKYLQERLSRFWLTSGHERVGDPPPFGPLAPLEAVGKTAENHLGHNIQARHMDGSESIHCERTNKEHGEEKTDCGTHTGMEQEAEKQVGALSAAAAEEANRLITAGASCPEAVDPLAGKNVLEWTTADVQTWVRTLPRGLASFAEAEAFAKGRVDGKKLATLTLADMKRKEFHHANFKAKVPTALWVEIKQVQQSLPSPCSAANAEAATAAAHLPSRFSPGQTIVDDTVNTPLCTVKRAVGQGAFGEVYEVVWKGIGSDRGSTLAMKTTRLADISLDERDEYRVLLVEEILTAVRVKSHPNVVNVRFAHIMGFCSESEEYFCFEDFVTGGNLEDLISQGEGELYHGTPAEIQGRLLSYSIQLARGLGHIHCCGVLHQDIKSTNIMVSSDARMLIADFGFATVGKFGPPPQVPNEEPTLGPPAATEAGVEAMGERLPDGRASDGTTPSDNPQSGVDANSGRSKEPTRSLGRDHDDVEDVHPDTLTGGNKYCDKRWHQARTAAAGSVAAAEGAQAQQPFPVELPGQAPVTLAKSSPAMTTTESTGGQSPLIEGDGDPGIKGSAGKEFFGGKPGVPDPLQKNGDLERPPNRDSVLLGTLKGFTPRYQSPEVCAIMDKKEASAAIQARGRSSQVGAQKNPHASSSRRTHDVVDAWHALLTHRSDMWAAAVVVLEMYAGGLATLPAGRGDNALDLLETLVSNTASTANKSGESAWQHEGGDKAGDITARARSSKGERDTLVVDMPEGVLEVLREVFQRSAGKRPVSMEVLAARFSETLRGMLEKNLAVVPCPSEGSPSPSSLCEQAPVYAERDENHAKIGRLHMWLGKALFLKGEDRREQALQEYREGVRVLQESKADRRSTSMALFHWYLGKALLEAGEIDEALPHLTEAVSIDPENAKYRHSLGLAKCVTGDDAGAREDLLEAALLDKEDAEYRYQLRVRRVAEKEREREKEQQRSLPESEKSEGADAPQATSSPTPDDAEGGGKPPAPATPTGASAAVTPSLARSRSLELEKASSSTRTYTLQKLDDYRTVRGSTERLGDSRDGGGLSIDTGRFSFGVAAGLPKALGLGAKGDRRQVRRFRVGDEITFGPDTSAVGKALEPLRSRDRSSLNPDQGVDAGNAGDFVIDGLLSPEQASLNFPGEAYTAKKATSRRRRQEPGDNADGGGGGDGSPTYHVVHIRFENNDKRATATKTTAHTAALSAEATSSTAAIGDNYLAPIVGTRGNAYGAGGASLVNSSTEVAASPTAGCSRRSLSPPRTPSPTNRPSLFGSTHGKPEEEWVAVLKAIGLAAMVGFHAQLAGAIRHLTWKSAELTLVADSLSTGCSTLREVLTSGSLHRVTEIRATSGGGRSYLMSSKEQTVSAQIVVDRILKLARQMAAAISHCHRRGVLLRTTTPDDVLVTPQWNAILRPNYSHAHEGRSWTIVSVRDQQSHRQAFGPFGVDSDNKPLTAPFTNATSPDYQSPEVARIRSEANVSPRVSGRALRLSAAATSSLPTRAGSREEHSLSCPVCAHPGSNPEPATTGEGGKSGAGCIAGSRSGAGDDVDPRIKRSLPSHRRLTGRASSDDQQQVDKRERGKTDQSNSDPLSMLSRGGQPMVTASESDIWAWALMVLRMFSHEAWPPGCGQQGLLALEALLLRRQGVDVWTTEDVIFWLRDIGLWSEKVEREIRTFKIAGRQLLVPTCRRDIVEKLGLFITDVELSRKLWESIAGGLQRWSVPLYMAQVLRRCLADSPDDRISTMDEVCELLRGKAGGGGASDGDPPAWLATNDYDGDVASERLLTGMILNDIGVCLCGKRQTEKAERYYKMALLSSDDVVEAYYNLGLLYSMPAFSKFREAQQAFDAATERMDPRDPRHKSSIGHAKAAERKSNYHQSQEMMKALSGKYTGVPPRGSRDRGGGRAGAGGAIGGATRNSLPGGRVSSAGDVDDDNRRASFLHGQKPAY